MLDLLITLSSSNLIMNISRYMVLKPYGKHLELSSDGIDVILACLCDVTRTVEIAASHGMFHRDIKPFNIIVHHDCGYLIDCGVATDGCDNNNLSATLAYCSINVCSLYYCYRW